ncbi:MAG: type II toxin-antitoxin system HicB family antitoxin [Gaiellaceae bacterium MAG52_C11]|nr:type II toxin-antitoxin system HicB family antitoxin [Candidatus Gaiellasilicea maunaloa]
MQMAHHLHAIQEDLAAAAALAADEPTSEAARRLSQALGSSLHLRLLDIVSEAAADISAAVPGRIEVRLAGRDPELVYVDDESEATPALGSDDALSARITLRLPDSLKIQIDVAASREGVSTNSWIVRALARGLESRPSRSGRRLTGFAES